MTVNHFPLQAHCFAFGGLELQMLAAIDAANKVAHPNNQDVKVNKIDVWSRDAAFDIAHFWTLSPANALNIYWAKQAGKKIVVTALLGTYSTFRERLRHFISSRVYNVRMSMEIVPQVDALVVLNEHQKEIAIRFFKFSPEKIFVIPNIVHDRFFEPDSANQSSLPLSNYVLCTGNVSRRKNQLRLAQACADINANLIIAGKALHGEESYGAELDNLVARNSNMYWYKNGLPENSDTLVQLIKNCNAFALPSYVETQPISMLEAAAARKPLITAQRGYAHQKYYENARLVNPDSVKDIAAGIKDVMNMPTAYVPPFNYLEECRETAVGSSYLEVYRYLYGK